MRRPKKAICVRGHDKSDAYAGGRCRTCKTEYGKAHYAAKVAERKAEKAIATDWTTVPAVAGAER